MALPEDDELELEDEIEVVDEIEDEEEVEAPGEDPEAGEDDEESIAAQGKREDANVVPERKQSRAETRIQALANARRAAEERAAKAEERAVKAEELARQNAQNTQQQYQMQQAELQRQAQLRQQWDNAGPEERVAMMLEHQRQQNMQQMALHQIQLADIADKTQFDAMASGDKIAAKYKDEVEARLGKLRSVGINTPRADIYKHLLGEKLLAKRAEAAKTQKQAAKKKIKQQTTPARQSRGDRAGGRPSDDERLARYKRLENLPI